MGTARTRYEVRVATHMGSAAMAALQVPVRLTAVPRRTLYRFRVPADQDLAHALARLLTSDVEVLEIRQCTDPSDRPRAPRPATPAGPPEDADGPSSSGVVLAFRRRRPAPARPGDGSLAADDAGA
ncbi:hypothetical protein [Blastococcus sp. SYSU D00695]